ncbi:MAG: hypothetical protein HQL11_06650, partial [Candidatus Omnitrophica bacterium]|nr:hypothetical protein [Candidatus Omnitrophota bacterium]
MRLCFDFAGRKRFLFIIIVFGLIGGMVCFPSTPLMAEELTSADFDQFQRDLDELDSRIEAYLDRARENSFWKGSGKVVQSAPAPHREPPAQPVPPVVSAPTPPPVKTRPEPSSIPEPEEEIEGTDITQTGDAGDVGGSRTRVSGNYRLAFGVGRKRNFSINDANSDLQDKDFHYLFGERRENTYDPAIYSRYQVDIDADITENSSFYTQITADPWSYVGVSSETVVSNNAIPMYEDHYRIRQKYWGANNSVVPQKVVTRKGNYIQTPETEIDDGKSQGFTATGFTDWGTSYTAPRMDLDFEFRPIRKMWSDFEGDIWHARVFALADQSQVLATDDPLGLSDSKDFWESSAWLDQWVPIKELDVSPVAIRRGHYDDNEAFYAKDSEGNYLTLLRGAALEADFGRTYVGGMIASRYGLWDEYQVLDNVPGVLRIKHQLTPEWMIGGLYGFRVGMIDREPDAYNQVFSTDSKYYLNATDFLYGQVAASRNDIDRLSSYSSAYEGMAYRTGFVVHDGADTSRITKFHGDIAWMDTKFFSSLSKYSGTRDDEFWGNHISFAKTPYDLDPFRIGTGLDKGRTVARLNILTEAADIGVTNLFDVRHVRDTDTFSFKENV